MKSLLKKVLGDPHTKPIKAISKRVDAINLKTDRIKKLSDKEIKLRIKEIRTKIESKPERTDEFLEEVFAITREAAQRSIKMRHFDVQLMGGVVLHEGKIAEMGTGEGKTLVATLPVVLNALSGKGVHVITVNDYLAQRDAGWMGGLYNYLGLSIGVIIPYQSFIYDSDYINDDHDDERFKHLRPCTRQEAYAADITYGTNNEFGFDYLRDNMVRSAEDLRQKELHYAIVDEVDSILIDEARTPLIISAPAAESADMYRTFSKAIRNLKPEDYELDEKRRTVSLTDDGVEKMQKILKIKNLYDASQIQVLYHLEQALRAETLFKRDKDYVVNEGEVVIVDEFTGRLMVGRRYSEGLHQAIEAKEGVEVQQESSTLATISFQNYFRLYEKLAGMTGTAATESEEFHTIYKLDVVVVPPNKVSQRADLPDRIYKSEIGKYKAIVSEIAERNKKGQPVLLGTVSVEKNELLSRLLSKAGIKHEVLNAKNNEREASIVSGAGQKGAVTLATNIAGRGTDIVLGKGIVELGGLHVIGSERHESRRIDNQLRGRAGRQGDPGSTQFYVSVEDDLMRVFGGERLKYLMEKLGVDEETPIEHKTVSKALENAQKKVESHNFDTRKNLVQYDDVMNRHRKAIYAMRKMALTDDSIKEKIFEYVEDEASLAENSILGPDKTAVIEEVTNIFNLTDSEKISLKKKPDTVTKILTGHYEKRRKDLVQDHSEEVIRGMEKEIFLQVLDELWMQHLESMQHLREGIGWRSVGQKDPLVEYRREGQLLFDGLLDNHRATVVRLLSHVKVQHQHEHPPEELDTALTRAAEKSSEATGSVVGGRLSRRKTERKNSSKNQQTVKPKPDKRKSKRSKQKKKRK